MSEDEGSFGPDLPPEVSLELGEGFDTKKEDARVGLSRHKAFIDASKKNMSSSSNETSQSYAKQQRADRQLYWVFTRILVLVILGWLTVSHLVLESKWVFIDGVNLLFHEAGHVVFRWGGETLWFLGGGLLQLLLPAAVALYFAIVPKERFAASACLWWVGENLLNIAHYMHDAPLEELPLLGGDTHDWNHLFTQWELLDQAQEISYIVRVFGTVLMIGALAYMVFVTVVPTARELR